MTLAQDLRSHVCDLLDWVGPDAPTLCEGWTARDLAAHLAIRDRRPDALPGIGIERFAGYTKKVQDAQAARPYPETVDLVRSGPPVYVVTAIPAVDDRVNVAEYAIHAEDVRRAQTHADADALPALPRPDEVADAAWRTLPVMARMAMRKAPVTVVARCEGRDELRLAKGGAGRVVLAGEPLEVLLLVAGRGEHAQVDVQGSPKDVAAFRELKSGL